MAVPQLVYSVRAKDESRATFERNRREIEKTRRVTQAMNADMQKFRNTMGALKGFGAGLGIGILATELSQIPGLIRGVVAESSNLAKVADRVALTTDELQRLQYGFELAGVGINQTNNAMQRFSRRVAQAAAGSGQLAKIFAANGIALRDNEGRLRSQSDILADYADLIKNAASEQERLLLAFRAFDREGAALVLGLKNGSEGLREMMGLADQAGGVLEEKLLRRAEAIDDRFAKMWRTFEIGAKSAALVAADWVDTVTTLVPPEDPTLKDAQAAWAARLPGLNRELNLAQSLGDEARADEIQAQIDAVNARLAGIQSERRRRSLGFSSGANTRGGRRGRRQAQEDRPTVIPAAATRSGSAIHTQVSDYQRVLDQLQQEQALLGMTGAEQRKVNMLRLAGVEATSKQGRAIAALVEDIAAQNEEQQRAADLQGYFNGLASDGIGRLIGQLGLADDATGRLIASLADAALKAALLGQGPLASVFGAGGGGSFLTPLLSGLGGGSGVSKEASSILSAFTGLYANGGVLGAGQWGIAGENGLPEPVVGPARIVSNKDAFSGGPTVVNVTIQTQNVESFRQSETQISALMADAVRRGQRGR